MPRPPSPRGGVPAPGNVPFTPCRSGSHPPRRIRRRDPGTTANPRFHRCGSGPPAWASPGRGALRGGPGTRRSRPVAAAGREHARRAEVAEAGEGSHRAQHRGRDRQRIQDRRAQGDQGCDRLGMARRQSPCQGPTPALPDQDRPTVDLRQLSLEPGELAPGAVGVDHDAATPHPVSTPAEPPRQHNQRGVPRQEAQDQEASRGSVAGWTRWNRRSASSLASSKPYRNSPRARAPTRQGSVDASAISSRRVRCAPPAIRIHVQAQGGRGDLPT